MFQQKNYVYTCRQPSDKQINRQVISAYPYITDLVNGTSGNVSGLHFQVFVSAVE